MNAFEQRVWLTMSAQHAREIALYVQTAAGWERMALLLRTDAQKCARRWLLNTLRYRMCVEVSP